MFLPILLQLSLILSTQHSCMVLRADGRLSPEQYQMFRVFLNHLKMRSINYSYLQSQAVRPPCSKTERDIFALPARIGGQGILNPSANSQPSFNSSDTLAAPLVNLINTHNLNGSVVLDDTLEAKKNIRNSNHLRDICHANELDRVLSTDKKRKIAFTKEKGSSSWLTVLPIEEHGFFLNRGEFRDALHLRCGWDIWNAPQSCIRMWLLLC